jgi:ribonuclease P protein component
MPKNSLHRTERIKSRKLIASLFETGHKVHSNPLLLIWLPVASDVPLKFGVSVPKRRFRRAVDRNLIKRRLREAYRISKSDLISKLLDVDKSYALFVVYVGHEVVDFGTIEDAMKKLLSKWCNRL